MSEPKDTAARKGGLPFRKSEKGTASRHQQYFDETMDDIIVMLEHARARGIRLPDALAEKVTRLFTGGGSGQSGGSFDPPAMLAAPAPSSTPPSPWPTAEAAGGAE